MLNQLNAIFGEEGLMPHGHCFLWMPELLWLHVISDTIIALAYLFVACALIYFLKRRTDLPFRFAFVMFGLFILLCGFTHAFNIVTIWTPIYWAEGVIKSFTAMASLATVAALWLLIPKALAMPDLGALLARSREIKAGLRSDITAGDAIQTALRSDITAGDVIQTALRSDITAGDAIQTALRRDIAAGDVIQTALRDNITERLRAEKVIFGEKERLRVTLNCIGDAVITTDVAGNITYLNPVAEAMTGWTSVEANALPLTDVFQIINSETNEVAVNPVERVLQDKQPMGLALDTLLVHRNGKTFPIEDSAAPIRDLDGDIIGTVLVFHDVSHAHKMATQMTFQASHDALTGLINRREFERRLEHALQAGEQGTSQHTLLYLDLDQFKIVNDTCGHMAGDELLRQLTSVLQAKLRRNDTLGRLGGDEFGVLLEGCAKEPALRIADLLRQTVREFHFVWKDKVFSVGLSIGLVTFSAGNETLADILRKADAACYLAKDKGRNRVQVYMPDDVGLAQRHGEMGWVVRIQKALKEDRFVLYSQKILRLNGSKEGAHYEVLLRMKDEDGTLIPPMAFIPAAERYGLMPNIDRWVITTAFAQHKERHPSHTPVGTCAINLSAASICDETFYDFVAKQFDLYKVLPSGICFEITETSAIANLTQATALMGKLKELGCRFSLDDFGSGMSSFTYLKHLPVDYLKIDGGFVKDMVDEPINQAMVEAINDIGHVMHIKTIAEFVENDAILAVLRRIGVDYAQGYGIEKPRRV
ncbi:MAG: EAL domain-containing protein [Nitrosospira sp.]